MPVGRPPHRAAARRGDVPTTKSYLGNPSIHILTRFGAAVSTGCLKEARNLLLEAFYGGLDYGGLDFRGATPQGSALACACARADAPMVLMLLGADASVNSVSDSSKDFNTYDPLYFASRMGVPPFEVEGGGGGGGGGGGAAAPAKKQAVLGFTASGAGGGAAGFALPAAPARLSEADERAARELIVRMLVANGAGTELEEAKRPTSNGGWGTGEPEPVFSEAQAALIRRALGAGA